jgi:hypothetical protein
MGFAGRAPVNELSVGSTMQICRKPIEDIFYLEISRNNLATSRLKYTIAGSDGRILQSGPVTNDSMDITVGALPSGLHFFSITDEHRLLAVRRFFKR